MKIKNFKYWEREARKIVLNAISLNKTKNNMVPIGACHDLFIDYSTFIRALSSCKQKNIRLKDIISALPPTDFSQIIYELIRQEN